MNMITIQETDYGIRPHATDDDAILRALKGYHFDLSHRQHNLFCSGSDRQAYTERQAQVRQLILDREPEWDGMVE